MNHIIKIFKYQLINNLKSKTTILYFVIFAVLTEGLFRLSGSSDKVIISLMNIVIYFIPLISIILGIMFIYNSREFIEMTIAQPVRRSHLFTGLFAGIALPYSFGYAVAVALPFLFRLSLTGDTLPALGFLLLSGVMLNLIFFALSFLIALFFIDRLQGLGSAIVLWLFFALIFDGIILIGIYLFSEYPIEKAVLGITFLNPIDLARIVLITKLDISALMGYTGAVFNKFFGSALGIILSLSTLLIWFIVPYYLSYRMFLKRDF